MLFYCMESAELDAPGVLYDKCTMMHGWVSEWMNSEGMQTMRMIMMGCDLPRKASDWRGILATP